MNVFSLVPIFDFKGDLQYWLMFDNFENYQEKNLKILLRSH